MKTVKKMDAGDICKTDKITITENMTVPELVKEISEKAPELIYSTLKEIYEGKCRLRRDPAGPLVVERIDLHQRSLSVPVLL